MAYLDFGEVARLVRIGGIREESVQVSDDRWLMA